MPPIEAQIMLTEHPGLINRISAATGKTVTDIRTVQRGYTPAQRMIFSFSDGSSLFAKIGTNEFTSGWLRNERHIYESLIGSFMPSYLGFDDDEMFPILLLADLSDAYWPPPWDDERIQQVLDSLEKVWQSSLPDLPLLSENTRLLDGWHQVAEDPKPFLSLGLASADWLDKVLPRLVAIDGPSTVHGDSLLHLDLRSDNMCIVNNHAVFIDWNNVCIGNRDFDLGAWLPSLEMEGGPAPETILPMHGEIAGLLSGYFAARAGLPRIPNAPNVRMIQLTQLKSALPWAVRSLKLPPLDGFAL